MSFWGKIIGGIAGFATGGPVGAVMGAIAGHAADNAKRLGPNAANMAAMLGSREQLFAISVVVLSAKLAKCDGPVVRAEIDAFKRMFRIPPQNMKDVAELFDEARETATDFEPFADRLGEAFAAERPVLEDVLSALFQIARADGPLTRGEVRFLQRVQIGFGLEAREWERARDGQARPGAEPERGGIDAYAVLGLPKDASDEQIRATWRRLMRENHPDAMAARGMNKDIISRATDKVAEINSAWDRIKRERKL
ncbi:TerB family tellurite resistance protein [Roseococcus sp. YIM B11640]|uniref:TerB family tellurite resistance protein n=1 Tax=Roseococcus sp. YIM B11640 TaxID=3133973 RepID=UPI003C798902